MLNEICTKILKSFLKLWVGLSGKFYFAAFVLGGGSGVWAWRYFGSGWGGRLGGGGLAPVGAGRVMGLIVRLGPVCRVGLSQRASGVGIFPGAVV